MDRVISIEIDQQIFRSYGALTYDDAWEVVEEVLDLDSRDVLAAQKLGGRRIDIGISESVYEYASVQRALDDRRRLSSEKIVSISEADDEITDVYVKNAPLRWKKDRFLRIFSYFGVIKKLEPQTIKIAETRTREYIGKYNGIMNL